MNEVLKKIQVLDGFTLKMIAIITMVIDHTGAILFPQNLIFRYIGRIAFPIFCFLLVEGFHYTKNIRKYMARMAGFAMISEIPYDLAFRGKILEFHHQNVFFTLLLGLVMMYFLEHTTVMVEKIALVLVVMSAAYMIHCDYGYRGLLLILVFYVFIEKRMIACTAEAAWNLIWSVWKIQIYGAISAFPILMYNGKQGRKMKYFFYVFYPVHLLLIYSIGRYLL